MNRPALVVVTNLYPNSLEPTRGIYIKQLVDRLRQSYEITVVAPVPWKPRMFDGRTRLPYCEKIDGIEVLHPRHLVIPKILRMSYGLLMLARLYPLLKGLRQQGRCDCISGHWVYPDGFAAATAAHRLRIPVVLHSLGCDINDYTKYVGRRVQIVFAMKQATSVVAKSRDLANKIVSLGVRETEVHVVPNGVDREKFEPGDKRIAREQLALPAGEFCFLYIGNLNHEKNVVTLVRAFARAVGATHDAARLYLVGDGPERKRLEKEVRLLNIEHHVSFIGRVEHTSIVKYYQAADCLCLPSLREGCPNVILEAQACGLPVIASNVGGVPEMVEPNSSVLLPPVDVTAWAEALATAIADPPKGPSNFLWWSWEENADRIVEIIDKAIETHDQGL